MTTPVLLAVSHGTSSPAGRRAVAALVDAVAERMPDTDVRAAHVDVEAPDVPTALTSIPPDREVVIVPLLLAAGYHVHVDLAEAAAMRPGTVVAPALGPDARLAEVLAARIDALEGFDDDNSGPAPIVLAAAGSSDARANDASRDTARLLAAATGRPVTTAFLAAESPTVPEALAGTAAEGRPAELVASYLLAPGYFHDLVTRLADGTPVTRPLLDDDRPHSALVDLVIARYTDTCKRL